MFLVEGNKTINELPNSAFKIREIYSIAPQELIPTLPKAIKIDAATLKKISFLRHPKDSVAICYLKEEHFLEEVKLRLILDGIQDPGNLGTIIRLADWFGIEEIVCSRDTADFYNPKVIMSSMGSFTRVNIVYTDLEDFLPQQNIANLATDMEGTNLYQYEFPEAFNLILGNEGQGIRPTTEAHVTEKISIPQFGKVQKTESLNVAMATAVILGQIYRK